MTTIAKRKTVCRAETSTSIHGRTLIIELRPYTVYLREKGRRKGFELSWDSAYLLAASKAAEQLRRERKAQKKGKS